MRFLNSQLSRKDDETDEAHDLAAISPYLQLKISPRARRVALRLDSKARIVHLVVPPRFNRRKALAFAQAHKDWIADKITALPAPVPFTHGQAIPVLGRERNICIIFDSTLKKTTLKLDSDEIHVKTNQNDPSLRITRFLKAKARAEMTALAHDKAARTGKTVKAIQMRDTKSRWGSCSPDQSLNFSWRLIFAPYEALDYLVAHEVAHLTHMNHGPQFWALCEELSADYKAGKSWLRAHGHTLLRYGSAS